MKLKTIYLATGVCFSFMIAAAFWVGWNCNTNDGNNSCYRLFLQLGRLALVPDLYVYGSKGPFAARRLSTLATISSASSNFHDADVFSAEALRISEKCNPPESKRLFLSLLNRGNYAADCREAVAVVRKALRIAYRQAFSKDFPAAEVARAEEALGDLLELQGDYDECLLRYKRALDWRMLERETQALLQSEDVNSCPAEATLLEKIALRCLESGQKQDAETAMAQALKLRKRASANEVLLDHWLRLGDFALEKGEFAQADMYYKKTAEAARGDVLVSLSLQTGQKQGKSFLRQKKYDESRRLFEEVLSHKDLHPSARARTQALLALLLFRQGKIQESFQLLQAAEPVLARQSPWSRDSLDMYELYASTLKQRGDVVAARQMEARAAEIRTRQMRTPERRLSNAFAMDTVFLVPAESNLIYLKNEISRLNKKLKEFEDKKSLQAQPGGLQVRLADCISARADLLDGPSFYSKSYHRAFAEANAEIVQDEVDTVPETEDGGSENPAEAGGSADRVESKSQSQKELELAQSKYESALAILEKQGSDPDLVLRCLIGLGKCYVNTLEDEKAERTLNRALTMCKGDPEKKLIAARILEYLSEVEPERCKTPLELKKYRFDLLKRSLSTCKSELGNGSNKVADLTSALSELAWYIPDAEPSGKELNMQSYSTLGDCFERDLTAFGPIHPQMIQDLELSRANYTARNKEADVAAIQCLFFGETDHDFVGQLKKLCTFDGSLLNPDARLSHFNCLIPLLLLLCGLLVLGLIKLPQLLKAKERKISFAMGTLCSFCLIMILILLFLPDPEAGQNDSALNLDVKLLKRALAAQEKSADFSEAVETAGTLGALFTRLRRFHDAESCFRHAEEICSRHKELPERCLSGIYYKYAIMLNQQNRTKEAGVMEDRFKSLSKSEAKPAPASSAPARSPHDSGKGDG